jgi:L-cystine uptake protein TcyP (sodium:dicarboxylate symporter family)
MNMNETVVIPIIMSIVEMLKGIGLPSKFSAIAAVLVGTIIGIFFVEPGCLRDGIFKGIVYGLTASGLYSGTKNTFQQVNQRKNKKKDKALSLDGKDKFPKGE